MAAGQPSDKEEKVNIVIPMDGRVSMVICSSFVSAKYNGNGSYNLSGENFQMVDVTKENGKFVARFTEIDPSSVTAEVRPSKSKHFQYVARLRYHEMTYESEGKTRKAALKGPWKCVNVRRLTEMPRYAKGKWEN